MTTLTELAEFYKTDKKASGDHHNYLEAYDKWFGPIKDKVTDLLEIGILKHPRVDMFPYEGASLLMWNDFFTNATINGMDINDHRGMNRYGKDRINIYIGDQGNRERLKSLMENDIRKEMDIIIDDGSHWMHHQQISLAILFKYLKSGGIYVIEDLFTSHPPPPFAPMSSQLSKNDTLTQDMLHDFVKTRNMVSIFMTREEMDYLNQNIDKCILEKGRHSEIVFITKK